jgi:DNA-binding CsgD family transcriptional regulator/tetratricopeptide (TPR) repeat protein
MFAVPSLGTDGPLVGRETETARLAGMVEALGSTRGAVLEIAGDPGIGKTRLLGVLAELAERRGVRVARAHATRRGTAPYQVFRDAWGDRSGFCRFSATADGLGATPAPQRPLTVNGSLFRAIRTLLADWAADGGGGLLLLDDFHLCDQESAALAAQLIRTPVSGPFLLAMAHRPRQTPAALLEALDCGAQTGSVVRIELAPLDPGAVATLLESWRVDVGSSALAGMASSGEALAGGGGSNGRLDSSAYAGPLYDASEGTPRSVRILVAAGWQPDGYPERPGADRDGLLREVAGLTAELDALTPDAVTAADAAAVLGDLFCPADVAEVSGLGLDRTLDALAELSRGDVVRPLACGGRFAFRDRVLRHVAHERAEPCVRLSVHRRALELFTRRGASAAARARHAEHVLGADSTAALNVLAEGAAEVIAENPGTAARWLRLALHALPGQDRNSPPRTTLMLACCRALSAAGRLEEARALAHELLRDPSNLPADLRLSTYAVCAGIERLLGRYEEAEALARTALDRLPRPLPAQAAELAFQYGLVHLLRGTYQRARPTVREAARATAKADDAAHMELRVLAACGDAYRGDLTTAAPEATQLARLVDALPDARVARPPELLAMLGCSELYMERFSDASRHLRRGLTIASGGAQQRIMMHHQLWLSTLDQWTGQLDGAEHRAREAEGLARAIGADDAVGLAMTMRASALMWARGRREAAEIVALAEQGARNTLPGRNWCVSSAAGLLAQIQLMNGDPTGCLRTLLEQGGGENLPLLQRPFRPSLLAMLSTAALQCRDVGAARRWARHADAAAEELGLPVQQAYVHRARALLHVSDGEHDAAARLFEQSAEAFRLAGMPVQHAWTLVTGARSAEAAHGPAIALQWLDTAMFVSRTCRALRVREQVIRVRGKLGTRRSARSSAAAVGPAELGLLTEREREIAQLAAAGKRSREIGEQLFLSPRTVETHLSRIYRKLDVSSRAALARILHHASVDH